MVQRSRNLRGVCRGACRTDGTDSDWCHLRTGGRRLAARHDCSLRFALGLPDPARGRGAHLRGCRRNWSSADTVCEVAWCAVRASAKIAKNRNGQVPPIHRVGTYLAYSSSRRGIASIKKSNKKGTMCELPTFTER